MLSTLKKYVSDKDTVFFLVALAVIGVALFLPTSITLVATSLFFALFAFFKPQQSLLFLVVYVSIRPLLVEVNPGLKLIGDLITVIAFGKLVLSSGRDWKSLFSFKWFEWAFFAFLIFGSVSGLMQNVLPASVLFQIRTFIIMYLLYYIVSRMLLPEGWYRRLAWVTVWTGFIVSIHGLIEKLSMRQLLLPDVWKYKTLSATNAVRIYGLPGNPNSLALLLFFAILAVFFLKSVYGKEKHRLFLNINLVLFLGVFILTYSRGTWISAFIFGLVFILTTKNWQVLKRLVLAGVASIIIIYYPVNFAVQYFQSLGLKSTANWVQVVLEKGLARRSMKTTWRSCPKAGGSSISIKALKYLRITRLRGQGSGHSAGLLHCLTDRRSITITGSGRISTAASISTRIISTSK